MRQAAAEITIAAGAFVIRGGDQSRAMHSARAPVSTRPLGMR